MGKIITAPKVKNPTTGLWESVGSTDIHRVYIGSDEPTNLSVQIWIRVGTLEDGSECRTLMLRDARNSWYSPFDENMDGIVDEAENALKLGDQPSEYYATAEQIAHILNGTTVVSKAQKDENGNNISNTYATKQELKEIDTLVNEIVTTNLTGIINGTTQVGKAKVADSATSATQDSQGNIIANTYVNLAGTQTVSGAKTFSSAVNITNDTASSSVSTGALVVNGGIGCAGNIYGTAVFGAVWNDYAETRLSKEKIKPGMVVIEEGNDFVKVNDKDCVPAMIVTDTYGFCIGEKENSIPVALTGRVLAYVSEHSRRLKINDTVCAAKDGKIRKMGLLEKILKPECILGTVSSFPYYKKWGTGEIFVDNRIWIKIK